LSLTLRVLRWDVVTTSNYIALRGLDFDAEVERTVRKVDPLIGGFGRGGNHLPNFKKHGRIWTFVSR